MWCLGDDHDLGVHLVCGFRLKEDSFICYISQNQGYDLIWWFQGFPHGSDGKESTCNSGDLGLVPGLGRSSGEGSGYPLQYACLENPMDRGSMAGYSPWGHKSDTTERLSLHFTLVISTFKTSAYERVKSMGWDQRENKYREGKEPRTTLRNSKIDCQSS